MNPKLSIVVPVYKVEPYIRQCLDSLVNQTLRNIEIICVNDGSPDSCGKICDEYAKNCLKDVTIKVIHKNNEGIVSARNDGIKLATGEYITFVDSDDWLEIDYYERMFAALGNRTPDVFCSGGRYVEWDGKTEIRMTFEEPVYYQSGKIGAEIIARTLMSRPNGKNNKILYDLGYLWDKIYKTSFIKEILFGYDSNYPYGIWEDALFELEVFTKAHKLGACLEVGYHYRKTVKTSATTKYWKNTPDICRAWADAAHARLENEPAFKEKILQDAFLARCRMMLFNTVPQYFANSQNNAAFHQKLKEFKRLKRSKYFKESLRRRTPFDSKTDLMILVILNLPGFLPVWVLNLLRKIKYRNQ